MILRYKVFESRRDGFKCRWVLSSCNTRNEAGRSAKFGVSSCIDFRRGFSAPSYFEMYSCHVVRINFNFALLTSIEVTCKGKLCRCCKSLIICRFIGFECLLCPTGFASEPKFHGDSTCGSGRCFPCFGEFPGDYYGGDLESVGGDLIRWRGSWRNKVPGSFSLANT